MDKVQRLAPRFQVGVFTQHMVSNYKVKGILCWRKKKPLNCQPHMSQAPSNECNASHVFVPQR